MKQFFLPFVEGFGSSFAVMERSADLLHHWMMMWTSFSEERSASCPRPLLVEEKERQDWGRPRHHGIPWAPPPWSEGSSSVVVAVVEVEAQFWQRTWSGSGSDCPQHVEWCCWCCCLAGKMWSWWARSSPAESTWLVVDVVNDAVEPGVCCCCAVVEWHCCCCWD